MTEIPPISKESVKSEVSRCRRDEIRRGLAETAKFCGTTIQEEESRIIRLYFSSFGSSKEERLKRDDEVNKILQEIYNEEAKPVSGEGKNFYSKQDDFKKILQEISDLHDKKSADYGKDEDPQANLRASEEFGIPAWLATVLRAGDKVARIKSFAKKGKLLNESLEDSLIDAATYFILALMLYRETKNEKNRT